MISFSSWVIRSKEFSPISKKDKDLLIINRAFKDRYEIKLGKIIEVKNYE